MISIWTSLRTCRSWERVKLQNDDFYCPQEKKPFENIVGKEKKCWIPAFSPFPTFSIL